MGNSSEMTSGDSGKEVQAIPRKKELLTAGQEGAIPSTEDDRALLTSPKIFTSPKTFTAPQMPLISRQLGRVGILPSCKNHHCGLELRTLLHSLPEEKCEAKVSFTSRGPSTMPGFIRVC